MIVSFLDETSDWVFELLTVELLVVRMVVVSLEGGRGCRRRAVCIECVYVCVFELLTVRATGRSDCMGTALRRRRAADWAWASLAGVAPLPPSMRGAALFAKGGQWRTDLPVDMEPLLM